MSLLADDSAVMEKTKGLCESIVADSEFQSLMGKVETFLADDEARLQYQSVHELGDSLNQKQQAGVELGKEEISQFEEAREVLFKNAIASEFIGARQELEGLQKMIGQYVGMTLELGRVPVPEDFATGEGCCGGSGGGGCGC